ncbi:glycosyl transferase family 2 [Cellulophaga algicola DSM 14237]|uniref:Glycosyl transferase family 2 n=1 Tax=Cellulophaga algicola (strain DSM 14237 / IC166 / ACAM 630) TaxID=688270 RepID=E6X7M4_CELAD|nr:glycosyltransferase family 2 protein [Cellulophaga algicola]ADV50734.1 glycosyl transferase family 2 [Cellulophaga algicola DSM 14237]
MQNPLVSIVIPFKNTEDYFLECLSSISQQSYLNFEVIAVDDSSTDGSKKIATIIANTDDRFTVLTNQGTGIISALQLAYRKAKGTFITRMDADDVMSSTRLEVMVRSLQKYGTNHIAVGKVKYFSATGVNDGYAVYESWLNSLTADGKNFSEIYKECVIPSPCWMVHKSDFDRCGAFNSEVYPEDYDLAFRFYKNHLKCIPCDQVLHLWRDYSTRTSRTSDHYAENTFLDLKFHYFKEIELNPKKNIVLWGAGKKGKTMAQKLINAAIDFRWICNNTKKIGKHIYEVEMQSVTALKEIENPQLIITVANQEDQKAIKTLLESLHLTSYEDYYFFC